MENGKITIELDADFLLAKIQQRLSDSRLHELVAEIIVKDIEAGVMDKAVRSCTKKAMKELIPEIVRNMVDDDEDFYKLIKAKVVENVRKGFNL